MFQSSIVAFPWDLVDEGLDAALDLLQGEIGVTSVSVWTSTPPLGQMRARPLSPRCFRTDGGLCFQPEAALYEDSRCKPPTADWIKSRNPLTRISEGCQKREFGFRANVSLTRVGRLAERQPEVACKNVFGTASQRAVCLSNPDVQALLAALVRDLTSNYAVTAVVLADLDVAWDEAQELQLPVQCEEVGLLRRLLSLCFCESCRQCASASGLDAAAAQRVIEGMIDDILNGTGERFFSLDDAIAAQPILSELLGRYSAERSNLIARIVNASRCDVYMLHDESGLWESDAMATTAPVGTGRITRVNRIESGAELSPPIGGQHELRIPLAAVGRDDGAALVHALSAAVDAGYAGVELDHFGAIAPSREASVRQAVRIARRSVGV